MYRKIKCDPEEKKGTNCLVLIPVLLLSLFMVIACSNEPQPIHYGHDACSFCEMTIVSRNFAAQAVTSKGKQYKYDSVECLVNHLEQEKSAMDVIWVADFQNPGVMIEAQKANFVIADTIKSPMGANLAAIRHKRPHTLGWEEIQVQLLKEVSSHNSHSGHNSDMSH